MKVKVTIKNPSGQLVEHVAEVARAGDLLEAAALAMEKYRQEHQDVPLFDHSVIKIERV